MGGEMLTQLLSNKEKMEFIKTYLRSENSEQQERLFKTITSPIALRQAVAYITSKNEGLDDVESQFEIDDYLQKYEKKRKEFSNLECIKEEDKVIFLTLQLTLDQIVKEDEAVEIVNIISYLASDNIPSEMFSDMIKNETKLKSLIQLLDKYSIINFNEEQRVFSVDSLVQEVIRTNFKTQEENILEKALTLLKEINPDNVYHAMSIWNHTNKYDLLVKKFYKLTSKIVDVLFNSVGSYQQALMFGEKVLEVLTRTLGSDHIGTLELKNNVALVMSSQGKNQPALNLLKESSELLNQYPVLYLLNQHNIAIALSNEGKSLEALEVFQNVYERRKDILGPKHSDTLITEGHIALLKFHLDRSSYNNSLKVLNEVVKELKDPYGQETLSFQHNIGYILNLSRKFDEASKILREVHQKRNMVLGQNHPLTMKTQREIGTVFFNRGEYEKALKIYKEVYEKQEKVLGCSHFETLDTMYHVEILDALSKDKKDIDITNLVESFKTVTLPDPFREAIDSMIRFEKAMGLYKSNRLEDALGVLKTILQDKSQINDSLKLLANNMIVQITCKVADELCRQGRYQKALAMYNEVLNSSMKVSNNEDNILTIKHNIALTLLEKGQYQDSFTIFNEVLQRRKKLLGVNHFNTLCTQSNLARVLDRQNKFDQSLYLYREVIDRQKKTLGLEHLCTLTTQHNMAVVLMKILRYEEAYKLFYEVFEKRKKILGLDDSETLIAQNNIAKLLLMQKKYKEALDTFKEVFNKRKDKLGLNHPHTLVTQSGIACVLFHQGKYSEALQMFNQVFERQKNVLGDKHPETLTTKTSIEMLKTEMLKTSHESSSFVKHINSYNTVNSDGSKLHRIIDSDSVDAVNKVLSDGIDITQVTANKGNTPLHIATLKGNNKIVESVLRYAKQQLNSEKLSDFINAQTTAGKNTSLHVAAEKGFLKITKSLLECGAIYDIKNKKGQTPIDLSRNHNISNLFNEIEDFFAKVRDGKIDVIGKLSNLKGDKFLAVTNARNSQGHTLLQVALANKHKDIASALTHMIREHVAR